MTAQEWFDTTRDTQPPGTIVIIAQVSGGQAKANCCARDFPAGDVPFFLREAWAFIDQFFPNDDGGEDFPDEEPDEPEEPDDADGPV